MKYPEEIRKKAFSVIFQFLEDQCLTKSFEKFQEESGEAYDKSVKLQKCHLLSLLDHTEKQRELTELKKEEEELVSKMRGPGGVKTNRQMKLKKKPKCFIGSELVTWIVIKQIKRDRQTAVELGELLRNHGYFDHLSGDQTFQDDRNALYRWTKQKDMKGHYKSQSQSLSQSVPQSVSRYWNEESGVSPDTESPTSSPHHHKSKSKQRCSKLKFEKRPEKILVEEPISARLRTRTIQPKMIQPCSERHRRDSSGENIFSKIAPSSLFCHTHTPPIFENPVDLESVAKRMHKSLPLLDRYDTRRLKKYKECFVASDAVTYLMTLGYDPQLAVNIGKQMQHEFIIRHVSKTKSKTFANNDELFSFCEGFDLLEHTRNRLISQNFLSKIDLPLLLISQNLEDGLAIKTRSFQKESLKNCFRGNEAVNWMIKSPTCPVRRISEAIGLGNSLIMKGYIQHGSLKHPKPFLKKKQPYQFTALYHTLIKEKAYDKDKHKFQWSSKGYPSQAFAYVLNSKLGSGAHANVYRAHCFTRNHSFQNVAIKCLDMSRIEVDPEDVYAEVTLMNKWNHSNILMSLATFMSEIGPKEALKKAEHPQGLRVSTNKDSPHFSGYAIS